MCVQTIMPLLDPPFHASYIARKCSICSSRIHHNVTHQSLQEFGHNDKHRESLIHGIPESKRVQVLIAVTTVRRCRIVVGLID